MKTKFIIIIGAFLSIISSAFAADDTFVLSADVIKKASLDKLHQQGINNFEMFDIDSNGKISRSELENSTRGLENVPFYTSAVTGFINVLIVHASFQSAPYISNIKSHKEFSQVVDIIQFTRNAYERIINSVTILQPANKIL